MWLAAILLAGMARNALAQNRYLQRYIEPKWFTFRLSQVSAGVYAEGMWQETRIEGGEAVTYTRTFIGPSIGLQGHGSIYHPNFIRYTMVSDGAFGWAQDHFSGAGSGTTDELRYFGSAALDLSVLPGKPYNGGAFASYDHNYRDTDFFSRVLVETARVGGRATYETGPWTATGFYVHRDERYSSRYDDGIDGTGGDELSNSIQSDTLTLNGRHRRERGETALDYTFNQYTRDDLGRVGIGTDHSITASDTEILDDRGRFRLQGSVGYIHRDTGVETSDEYLATTELAAEHRPNLSSFYTASYDHFEIDSFETDSYTAQAGLTHRLYESLTSGLIFRASSVENQDEGSEGYVRRIGGGITESYTKRLTEDHRLRLEASGFLEHTEQDQDLDQTVLARAVNERHQILPAGENGAPSQSFFLNRPDVDPLTIVVTDQFDTVPGFVEGLDYQVIPLGSRTEIHWLRPPGPGVPTVVLVDYQFEPTAGGSYETLNQNYLVRFDLWNNLLGIYGRAGISQNNASEDLRVIEFVNWAVGADFTYRWFRAGAEYQLYDSSESDYRTLRLFQSLNFRPDDSSTLSLDFTETWTEYLDSNREEEDYRFITRYFRALSRRLTFNADAGVAYRTAFGEDQLLSTIRPAIRYVVGRTTIESGYDFQYELFLNREERQKHLLFVRLKRFL
jgi:hypothetical protein